jgi:PKD repeat protein
MDEEQKTLLGPDPRHTFRHAGTYVITMVISDEAGNYAIDTINITVLDTTKPGTLVLPDSHKVVSGTQLMIDGSGSYDNVGIVNWTWKVGDDEYYTPIIYLTFDSAGNHTVTLIIIDAAGNSAENTQIINVVDIPQIIPPEQEVEEKDKKKETSILVYISLGSVLILLVVLIIILFFRKDTEEIPDEE